MRLSVVAIDANKLEPSDLNSEQQVVNSEPSDLNSEQQAVNSEPSDLNSEYLIADAPESGEVMRPTDCFEQLEVDRGTEIPKSRKASRALRLAILEFCTEFRTVREIGDVIGRNADTVRLRYIGSMVSEGLLELQYSDVPNHPKQAYRTVTK